MEPISPPKKEESMDNFNTSKVKRLMAYCELNGSKVSLEEAFKTLNFNSVDTKPNV